MTHELIIEKTLQTLHKLPEDKAMEVADFADFILKRYEEQLFNSWCKRKVVMVNNSTSMAGGYRLITYAHICKWYKSSFISKAKQNCYDW